MAYNNLGFGASEDPLVVAASSSAFTAGVVLSPQTSDCGVVIEVSGTTDGTYDLVVETAESGTASSEVWQSLTSTRVNAQTGADSYVLPFVDPVLDQVRLRVTRTGGTGPANFTAHWGSDRVLTLNP